MSEIRYYNVYRRRDGSQWTALTGWPTREQANANAPHKRRNKRIALLVVRPKPVVVPLDGANDAGVFHV